MLDRKQTAVQNNNINEVGFERVSEKKNFEQTYTSKCIDIFPLSLSLSLSNRVLRKLEKKLNKYREKETDRGH